MAHNCVLWVAVLAFVATDWTAAGPTLPLQIDVLGKVVVAKEDVSTARFPHELNISDKKAQQTLSLHPITSDDDISDDDPYRLPRDVAPIQYVLHLEPNLDPDFEGDVRQFNGRVTIHVRILEQTESITLHASGIEIIDASVKRMEGEEEIGDNLLMDDKIEEGSYELIKLRLTQPIEEGSSLLIDITYTGTLRDDMYGFYISTFYDENNKPQLLAATQFQATYARRAFPCFDEPNFKAQFKVSIVAPQHMGVLGNMAVEEVEELPGELQEVTFENTMTMSSYLLAFVVSPFDYQEDLGEEGAVKFTTWARPDAINWAKYSLEVSRSMLNTLEDYTGILYSSSNINKVDQVALPDFAAGAMENWGLITYRETALLYNDGSADAKKRVATVIAHELLHMWFGNLVTTYWWDTTWLNEGFARFFQYYVTDKVESSWRMWDQFLVDQHQMVFALDALATAKALTHRVSSPAEVSASFGSITYNKGASVLRMISHTIGEENYRSALQEYLVAHSYSTVKPENLFHEFKKYSDKTNLDEEEFEELLVSWTELPGYPVVTVERDYEGKKCILSQERFLLKGTAHEQYYVPITWVKKGEEFSNTAPKAYIRPNENKELDGLPESDEWVIFNVQETGYYRVNYDLRNWELIAEHLKSIDTDIGDIHELNRAQLLDDAFNLARAGHLPYNIAFQLADYLKRETEYVPWAAALTAFSHLDRMLINHAKYPVFKRYILRLIDKTFERFFSQWQIPENHIEKLLVNRIASWACSIDHKMCINKSIIDLRRYLYDNQVIPADLRSVIYCHGIRHISDKEWSDMWELYKTSRDDVERGLLVNGLSCSPSEDRLRELLGYTIDGEFIRKQDASSVFSGVYSNPLGVEVALEFLDDNFDDVANYYGSMGAINNIVTGIAGRLTTRDQYIKLENFVLKHQEGLGTTADAALEIVEDNLHWLSTYQEEIFSILEDKELKQHRLPGYVSPTSYQLYFNPTLHTNSFLGTVSIVVRVDVAVDEIVLHAGGVEASVIRVYDTNTNIYRMHTYDQHLEFLTLYLTEPMMRWKNYTIYIEFFGWLRDDMNGFYLSSYTDENGLKRSLAATQFQPTHARKAFPCFDEPAYKATFTVSIKTPPYYHAIGNMPIQNIRVWDDYSAVTTFLPTPKMSTYLLALVVSDFVYSEDAQGNVVFRTWARPNALPWAQYSLLVSRDILEALEDYTAIPYTDPNLPIPLDKVDQVALPDFSAGAMENWGLVTYRETALLYNGGTASARKSVATIIAHELAHMWFGNLVTTHWWDTTWLNEGFAQYFQFFITDKVKPSWRLMDQFLVDHHQGIFTSDSLTASQALTADAYTPAQISARFSGITYSKGGSILRMLSAILGEENFQGALQKYLKSHSYLATKPDDLFEMLIEKASAANLNEQHFRGLLLSWTEQPGFPVIGVERDYGSRSVTVTQTRFLLKTPLTEDSTLYYVPLTWVVEGEDFSLRPPQSYITSEQKSDTVSIAAEASKWVIFNVQETGFYRVNYDAENWKLIAEYLVDSSKSLSGIHVLNRAQLLDDAFNLARAGQLPYTTAISVSDYLPREVDYIPWASALSAFSFLQRMLINNEKYGYFEDYVLHLVEDLYYHYEFQDCEEHLHKLLLNRMSAWACSLNHSNCTDSASAALKNYLDSEVQVPADLRSVVYCYGIRHSSSEYWDKLWNKYTSSLDNAERALIMTGLACTHDEAKLRELLQYSINEEYIRKQDASSVFTAVYSNSKGVEVALEFLDDNFDEVEKYYGSMGAINNIVIGISGRLTTEEQRKKMENFVSTHSDSLGSTADNALEIIDENLEWLNINAEAILNTLVDHKPPPFPTFEHPSPCTRIIETISTTEDIESSSTTEEIDSSSAPAHTTDPPEPDISTPGGATRANSKFFVLLLMLLIFPTFWVIV